MDRDGFFRSSLTTNDGEVEAVRNASDYKSRKSNDLVEMCSSGDQLSAMGDTVSAAIMKFLTVSALTSLAAASAFAVAQPDVAALRTLMTDSRFVGLVA